MFKSPQYIRQVNIAYFGINITSLLCHVPIESQQVENVPAIPQYNKSYTTTQVVIETAPLLTKLEAALIV